MIVKVIGPGMGERFVPIRTFSNMLRAMDHSDSLMVCPDAKQRSIQRQAMPQELAVAVPRFDVRLRRCRFCDEVSCKFSELWYSMMREGGPRAVRLGMSILSRERCAVRNVTEIYSAFWGLLFEFNRHG